MKRIIAMTALFIGVFLIALPSLKVAAIDSDIGYSQFIALDEASNITCDMPSSPVSVVMIYDEFAPAPSLDVGVEKSTDYIYSEGTIEATMTTTNPPCHYVNANVSSAGGSNMPTCKAQGTGLYSRLDIGEA